MRVPVASRVRAATAAAPAYGWPSAGPSPSASPLGVDVVRAACQPARTLPCASSRPPDLLNRLVAPNLVPTRYGSTSAALRDHLVSSHLASPCPRLARSPASYRHRPGIRQSCQWACGSEVRVPRAVRAIRGSLRPRQETGRPSPSERAATVHGRRRECPRADHRGTVL
jgi:hypothetical protein